MKNHINFINELSREITRGIKGIEPELSDFLNDRMSLNKDIYDYKIEMDGDVEYNVIIKLARFNSIEARKIFNSLHNFIGIQDVIFHIKVESKNIVYFLFVALFSDNAGVRLNIYFIP